MTDERIIGEDVLVEALHLHQGDSVRIPATAGAKKKVSEAQKLAVAAALRRTGNNRSKAAQELGISKTTLWRRMCAIERDMPGYLDAVFYQQEAGAT
jgi:transcriptional regulator with PAS, ATPase and Fis domain